MQVHVKQVLTGIDANAVADEALGKLDSNNDGKVTRDEFILNFLAVMQDVRGAGNNGAAPVCTTLSHRRRPTSYTQVFDPKQIIKSILDAMGM